MFARCTNCEIFLDENTRFCFNCGVDGPTAPTLVTKKSKYTFSLTVVGTFIFAVLVTSIVGAVTYRENPANLLQNILPAIAISIVLGFAFSILTTMFIESRYERRAWKRSPSALAPATLCGREDELFEKIAGLVEEQETIEGLKDPGYDRTSVDAFNEEERLDALASLNAVETVLYNLLLDEIKLLRIENNAYYLYRDLNTLQMDEIEGCAAAIESAIKGLDEMGTNENGSADESEPTEGESNFAEEDEDDADPEPEPIDERSDDAAGFDQSKVFTYDHQGFWDRADAQRANFLGRADMVHQSYLRLRDAIRRRADATQRGTIPMIEDVSEMTSAQRFASGSAPAIYDQLAFGYAGLLGDVRSEFDRLNSQTPA